MSLIALDGDISNPRTFSFAELRAIPQQTIASHPRVGPPMRAVPLGVLAYHLGLKSWARFAVVRSSDGYAANIPVDELHQCALAYALDDAPLPPALGGPLRLFARTLGCCANVKRVALISFAITPASIEHACAHDVARARGMTVLAGGRR
jgi:DMSO/TMAO reductase YedYZ molybdopterin-dependent catalytic subunit